MFSLLKAFLGFVLIVYLFGIAALYVFQRNMMYLPPKLIDADATAQLNKYETHKVKTEDGLELEGYYMPPSTPDAPVLMVFHGNASHPAWQAQKLDLLTRQLGAGIILVEYRGYGSNEGKPSQAGLFADARAWATWWQSRAEAAYHPIVYYGESLGSGIAVYLASIAAPDALVLETPYDSLLNVSKHHYRMIPMMGLILRDQYRSDELIAGLSMPKLFMIAGKDKIVPASSSQRLYDLAQEPKTREDFPTANHIQIFDNGGAQKLLDFLMTISTHKGSNHA